MLSLKLIHYNMILRYLSRTTGRPNIIIIRQILIPSPSAEKE